MRGSDLARLVEQEVAKARLHLRHEIRRGPTGCFLILWSDLEWCDGIGGRRVFGRTEGLRRREGSIGLLVLHSRVPTITWGGNPEADPELHTLYPPTRCPEPVLRALVAHAIAQTAPTRRRLLSARRRLREAGVRLSRLRQKPSYARRSAS
jgi:hypothetical protein